jgi:hypothetical protein
MNHCYDIITKQVNGSTINPLYLQWRDRKLRELVSPIVIAPFPYMNQTANRVEYNDFIYTGWIMMNVFHPKYYRKYQFITNEMIEYTLKWLLYEMWESTMPYVHGNLIISNLVICYHKLWILFNTYDHCRPLFRFKEHSELYRCVYIFKDLYTFGCSVTTNNRMTNPEYKFPYYDIEMLKSYHDYIEDHFNLDDYVQYEDNGMNIPPMSYKEEDKEVHYKLICHVHDMLLMIRLL